MIEMLMAVLVFPGELKDSELEVLLSETAARAIYQKWKDTLLVRTGCC